MKITVELDDDLVRKLERLAECEGTTVPALVEKTLAGQVAEQTRSRSYKLPDRSVGGRGLRAEFAQKPWGSIRAAAYR